MSSKKEKIIKTNKKWLISLLKSKIKEGNIIRGNITGEFVALHYNDKSFWGNISSPTKGFKMFVENFIKPEENNNV